jgi:hypothetical protein
MFCKPLQSNNIPDQPLTAAAGCKLLGDNNLWNFSKGVDSVTAPCYIGVSGKRASSQGVRGERGFVQGDASIWTQR